MLTQWELPAHPNDQVILNMGLGCDGTRQTLKLCMRHEIFTTFVHTDSRYLVLLYLIVFFIYF